MERKKKGAIYAGSKNCFRRRIIIKAGGLGSVQVKKKTKLFFFSAFTKGRGLDRDYSFYLFKKFIFFKEKKKKNFFGV